MQKIIGPSVRPSSDARQTGSIRAGSDGTIENADPNKDGRTQKLLMDEKGVHFMFPVTWRGEEQLIDPETGEKVFDQAGNPVMAYVPNVKAETDYIAPSNDEDGVAAAIREFFRISPFV